MGGRADRQRPPKTNAEREAAKPRPVTPTVLERLPDEEIKRRTIDAED